MVDDCLGAIALFYEVVMSVVVGTMITWTTYGTWLPGDGRGYVEKGGEVKAACVNLKSDCASRMVQEPVRLTTEMKQIVSDSIREYLQREGVELLAIAVCSNHVHLVVKDCGRGIGEFVAQCKTVGRQAVKQTGFEGKVWTKGYDRRFCFDEESLRARVEYVCGH